MRSDDLKGLIEDAGGRLESEVRLPDASGFATASFPLPKDHWLYADNDHVPPMPWRLGTDHPAYKRACAQVRAAARYAVRGATMKGKEMDFDPDALIQNLLVGLFGYHTPSGLSDDSGFNPEPVPTGVLPRWCTLEIEDDGTAVLSAVYNGVIIKTEQGSFGIAERDGGIEVTHERDGKQLSWSSAMAWENHAGKAPIVMDGCVNRDPHPEDRKWRKKPVVVMARRTPWPVEIQTLEGTMRANAGDYIITGVAGERYPCKPEIFEATYEPAGAMGEHDDDRGGSVGDWQKVSDAQRICAMRASPLTVEPETTLDYSQVIEEPPDAFVEVALRRWAAGCPADAASAGIIMSELRSRGGRHRDAAELLAYAREGKLHASACRKRGCDRCPQSLACLRCGAVLRVDLRAGRENVEVTGSYSSVLDAIDDEIPHELVGPIPEKVTRLVAMWKETREQNEVLRALVRSMELSAAEKRAEACPAPVNQAPMAKRIGWPPAAGPQQEQSEVRDDDV